MPLSYLFATVTSARRFLFRLGWFRRRSVWVPLIVVGNITAGGTGKTPVTIWLANYFKECGYSVGIVSRGYGGRRRRRGPEPVYADSDASLVGDEPVLMAKRTGCLVIVSRDRLEGARELYRRGVQLAISDDGLQHYAMRGDYDICVIDGQRRLGNRRLLPAGPLREPPSRLGSVDQVFINGCASLESESVAEQNALCFELKAERAVRIDGGGECPLSEFSDKRVHAVAGIGNPERFFSMLRQQGIDPIEHPLRDHAADVPYEFGDDLPVLMTEKDAVRLPSEAGSNLWFVPVDLSIEDEVARPWLAQLESRLLSGTDDE